MIIRLDVKKDTFRTYLVKLGFNYKIIQYETMIAAIQRKVVKDLRAAYEESTLTERSLNIFKEIGGAPSIYILEDKNYCQSINSEYLKDIIDQGVLDLYFEEYSSTFKIETQKIAYKIELLKSINFKNNIIKEKLFDSYYQYTGINEKRNISALKCINSNGINLTETEKDEIKREINTRLEDILVEQGMQFFTMIGRINLSQFNHMKYKSNDLIQFLKENLFGEYILNKDIYSININFSKKNKEEKELFKLRDHLRNVSGSKIEHVIRMMKDIHNGNDTLLNKNKDKKSTKYFEENIENIRLLKLVNINEKRDSITFGDKTFNFSFKDFIDYVEIKDL